MLSVAALTPAVSDRYLGLPTAVGSSVAKAPCLPLKPRSLPASVMVSPSGTENGGWEMLWARVGGTGRATQPAMFHPNSSGKSRQEAEQDD